MDVYEKDPYIHGLLDRSKSKGSLKEYQTVLSVGNTVTAVKEGDTVCIDPTRYMITKHSDKSLKNGVIGDNMTVGYRFNTVKIDNRDCLMLYDQDIVFVVEKSEEVEDGPAIIQPDKPEIIV